jgi:flavin-dependent dehydrogenase
VRRTAALIAGGGPAGAAAAITLAEGGARPLLIERQAEPQDVVCGGFLGWDALSSLDALGIDAMTLGARPISMMRLIAGARRVEAALPHMAAGLSRRTLDAALLDRAAAAGAAIERGVAIRRAKGPPFKLDLADGASIAADALFLASGKHELRGLARRAAGGAVGLRARLTPSPELASELAGVIELHLFAHGYAGLLVQEDGSVNLCLSIAAARLAEAGGKPERLLASLAGEAPVLADRIGAASGIGAWSAVAGVPYGWRAQESPPGLFRLGDQAAVIASLAGDGIAIAIRSGRAAAVAWLRDGPDGAPGFQHEFAQRAERPLRVAGALRRMAENRTLAQPLLGLLGRTPGLAALLARMTRIGS